MNIRWTQPTQSGLCDRLIDLLMLATMARMRNDKICFRWPAFEAKSIDTQHRSIDIRLDNVLKFLTFPKEIVFDPDLKCESTFDHYMGGGIDVVQFYTAYARELGTPIEFDTTLRQVAKDFGFCPAINEFLKTIPDKFITFHIRRGDKVRNESTDGTFIHLDELNWLNTMTYRAIDYYVAQGHSTFFVCGDEDAKKAPFVYYLREVKGVSTFDIPPMPKWQGTYYDLAVMTKSQCNVASQRYSSFSRFPSFLGNDNFTSVFSMHDLELV